MTDTLRDEFIANECNNPEKAYNAKCNNLLIEKESQERDYLEKNENTPKALYPSLNDPKFIVKIAEKKEFHDHTYDGSQKDIRSHADTLCDASFELAPHQLFVKNYLSFQTPYNSLLLYHQLGTGKTCSAIGICEEMRQYMKEMGISKRIIIVASPNVQDNFRLQLFDERKLQEENGLWSMSGCLGDSFIREINPTNIKNMTREKIITQIKNLINKSYIFLGYESFSNYITRVSVENNSTMSQKQIVRNLQREFSNRLIVVDEVHNIRISQEAQNKRIAPQLMKLVTYVDNIRLLLLSATPMYNTPKEIIWLLNLMNTNDKRGQIHIRDVFDKDGNLKPAGREMIIRKATGYVSYVRGENPYTFPYRVYPSIFSPKHTFEHFAYPEYQLNGKYIEQGDQMQIFRDKIYLTKISSYQEMVYNIILDKVRNTIKRSGGNLSFEQLDSFNYTILQGPLEALVMTYPMSGVEETAERIPSIKKYHARTAIEKEQKEGVSDEDILMSEAKIRVPVENADDEEPAFDGDFVLKSSISESHDTAHVASSENIKTMDIGEEGDDSEEGIDVEITKKVSSEASIMSAGATAPSDNEAGDASENDAPHMFIDVNSLTGKRGLSYMMNYTDTITPAVKGNFSYKTEKYGRIFSPKKIGKYSNKIKAVCDHIRQSSGIVLIYSQWIDAGLIPMALALEEMGMTRSNGTTLFASPPTEQVDGTTFETREQVEKAGKPFSPARYALITGDVRLSPDNDAEIKKVTNETNKAGAQVKVILISKAAAEGIDLKCIRQVHILEPWYTMSRIEQIIGRAVRNFSHVLLPFEERNVEIFLHGSIMSDEERETTDMYIYRLAEYKAKQIGEISRLLKETSVDCLLNTEQNNFSQVNMNTQVTQTLSDGQTLKNFRVGDIPYSAMCDYMENCDIKCMPDKKIQEKDINTDTYDERYIMVNSEKIIQKVRMLMKEEFFYKKSALMAKINHPKPFPKVEIYAALTHMIENITAIITDKYGRQGHLANIGDYYLFQPSEITAKNASVFDRKTPVDFKPIHFAVESRKQERRTESARDTRESYPEQERTASVPASGREIEGPADTGPMVVGNGKEIAAAIKSNLAIAEEYTKKDKVQRGDTHYYKHMGQALKKITSVMDVSMAKLTDFVIHHMVDILDYDNKLELLNYVTNMHVLNETDEEYKVKIYFDTFILRDKKITGIVLYDKKERHILIFDRRSNLWRESEEEDRRDLSNALKERYTIDTRRYSDILGFIQDAEGESELVFKTKDTKAKRAYGTRCEQTTKSKNIVILNKILGDDEREFTKESIKPLIDIGVCCLQEIVLRLFNKEKPEKVWFLDPETAKMYNI